MVGEKGFLFFVGEGLGTDGTTAVLQDDAVGVGDVHGVGEEGGVFLRGGGAVEEDVGVHSHEVAAPIDYGGGVVVAAGGEGDADAVCLSQQSVYLCELLLGEACSVHDGVVVVPVL